MDLKKLITERRTIQSFTAEKVPDEWVREAIELSLWAPNHKFTFPWVYILAGEAARARLGDLAVELKGKEQARAKMTTPSHLLFVGCKTVEDEKVAHENYATLACSVQLLTLALWEKGVGTKWSTGEYMLHPKTYEILGVSPTDVRLEGAIMIGKAAVVPPARSRPPLSSVLITR